MAKTFWVWGLTLALVSFFVGASYRKLSGHAVTAGHFAAWGYGAWLLGLVGSLELLGALLLLIPAWATSGALLLALLMVGASYTLLSHHVWGTLALTATCLLLLLVLGYLRWPQSWILTWFKIVR